MIEVWTLQRSRRNHLLRWRKELVQEINASIDEVVRCQNKLNDAIFQREAFKKQLTSLENLFKFDSK